MYGDLVECCTSDGVKLHGILSLHPNANEAWILLHGVNSNFYSSSLLLELAKSLHCEGMHTLIPNTRGHDSAFMNSDPVPMRLGSQFETLQHCVHDIQAWIDVLHSRGVNRVSIAGHSLGAIKCLYFVAQNTSSIERWIAISPPRLNTDLLGADPNRGQVFSQHLRDAVELCGANNPDYLMKVRFPMPMWISASTYIDKYGSKDRYDYLELAKTASSSGLWTFGGAETKNTSVNFNQADRIVSNWIESHRLPQEVHVIEDADHSYRGKRDKLNSVIVNWIEKTNA